MIKKIFKSEKNKTKKRVTFAMLLFIYFLFSEKLGEEKISLFDIYFKQT